MVSSPSSSACNVKQMVCLHPVVIVKCGNWDEGGIILLQ